LQVGRRSKFRCHLCIDHLIPHYGDDIKKNIFECFTNLTALAAITKKKNKNKTDGICKSYRHPSPLAKMLSKLDIISKERIKLAIGAGWYEQEYVLTDMIFHLMLKE
jgi:alkanesulfonate monooxygenase SsuD/methylene tetrahydromethanopterin reductase-like flavin-dependent oxidoreductase (luciferase family)